MKVYWVGHLATIESYDPEKHKYENMRFNYWKGEEVIVTGDLGEHYNIVEAARRLTDDIPDRDPDGAGQAVHGNVIRWNSYGYHFDSPEELKPIMLEALGLDQ